MDSPFRQYFGTNYTPTREEEGQIRDIVTSYRQEVRDIDDEIERLQKQIETLLEKREAVDEFADKHQELISPVRMLTQDILECIFLACISEGDLCPAILTNELPMLLTHVCSSWRRIALSTPRLWTIIHITLPVMHVERFATPGIIEQEEARSRRVVTAWQLAVNNWLDRSGACSLALSVRQETGDNGWHIGEDHVEGYNSAMERIRKAQLLMIKNIILSCHQRLYSLDLCVPDNIVHILVEAGVKNELCLQMLKHIHITRRRDSYSPTERIPFQFKDIWTILSSETASATLYDIQISYTNNSIPKNQCWMLLTELNLSFPNGDVNQFDVTLAILRYCPELITVKLKIDSQSNNSVGDPHATTIVLPHLTNLSVSLSLTPTALSFANQLYIPSLKELNIQFTTYGWISKPDEILKSLVRVADDFHTLILFEPEWIKSADDLIQALKVVPSVKLLKIFVEPVQHNRWDVQRSFNSGETRVQHALSDGLLHALNPMQKDYSDIICPRLEEFECDNKWLTVFPESVLKDFLISRRDDPRVVPIRRLVVTINNYKLPVDSDSSEKISLGDDSSVFFRRKDKDGCRYRWYEYELFSDMYKEL